MATPNGSIPPVSTQDIPAHLQTPEMLFRQAAVLWMKTIAPIAADGRRIGGYIRKTTEKDYERKLRAVCLFFGDSRLCDIRLDHITKYQRARVAGEAPFIRKRHPYDKVERPCPAKPQQVNQEMQLLIRILKRARLWGEEQGQLYQELREEISEMPRALEPEQQRRWLDVARSHPRWNLVHCILCSLLTPA
jgi:hypothetical protein